jgi:hypothetical protein
MSISIERAERGRIGGNDFLRGFHFLGILVCILGVGIFNFFLLDYILSVRMISCSVNLLKRLSSEISGAVFVYIAMK